MSEFRLVRGFEDVWRPPVRSRSVRPEGSLQRRAIAEGPQTRLARIVRRAPEVMVKVSGRTADAAHLAAHLSYITRNGALEAEDRDGLPILGRREVLDLAGGWAAEAAQDRRRRANSPMSVSLILSMPAGADAVRLRDAARVFAAETFAEQFEYVMVLHTDTAHPHVHLSICARAGDGGRLNPKKGDLEAWRQGFARALREHGVDAEATPRRARGVTRKAERAPMRKLRERHEAGLAAIPAVRISAIRDAASVAFGGAPIATAWEQNIVRRQAAVRALYRAQAELLVRSDDPEDRRLGLAVRSFVEGMPAPDTQRLALARELRAANDRLRLDRQNPGRER